jgi:hypothetical protein
MLSSRKVRALDALIFGANLPLLRSKRKPLCRPGAKLLLSVTSRVPCKTRLFSVVYLINSQKSPSTAM